MSKTVVPVLALALLVSAVSLPAQVPEAPPVPTSRTITVDCDAGGSLTDALRTQAEVLIIEFRGTCPESFEIHRGNTTLRGLDFAARVTGTVSVTAAAPVLLQGFTVVGGARAAVSVRRAAGVELRNMTLVDSSQGLALGEGASVRIRDSAVRNNSTFGIAAFGDSTVEVVGRLETGGNGFVGVLLSTGSTLQSFGSGLVVANDNGLAGVWLQIGADGQFPSLVARDNGFAGLVLFGEATYAGEVELTDNPLGVIQLDGGNLQISGQILGGAIGIQVHNGGLVVFSGEIDGTALAGLAGDDGVSVHLDDARVSSAHLTFGSRLTTSGSTTIGTLACDSTVLSRGPVSCPAPLAGDGPVTPLRPPVELPGEPFEPVAP